MDEHYVYNRSETFTLLKEGDYEATIDKIEIKTLSSGKEKIAITYRIRDDVEQEFKNRLVFEDIWQEKDNPKFFNRRRINQLLGTQEIEDGTSFENEFDLMEYLRGSNLIIHVGVEFDEYRGEDKNNVNYYKASKVKPATLNQEKTELVQEEDLPF